MSDRVVPGWLVALLAGSVVAAVIVVAAAPRIADLVNGLRPSPVATAPTSGPLPSAAATGGPGATGLAASTLPSALPSIGTAAIGTIVFGRGAGPDRCSVADPVATGPGPLATVAHTDPIYLAAVLAHPVATDGTTGLLILSSATTVDKVTEAQDPASPQCWSNRRPIGPLAAGQYVLVVLAGTGQEATAILTVT